jgi:hypothetical protein
MINKIKYGLLISLLIFLVSNIAVTLVFKNDLADSLASCGEFCFEEDSTPLLIHTNTIFMPFEPQLPKLISGLRGLSLLSSAILSIWLFIKDKKIKHLLYLCVSTSIVMVMVFVKLETVSPGIYDFFRKIKASYTLGVITPPWLFYYLIIVIPVILITSIITIDLLKIKKV